MAAVGQLYSNPRLGLAKHRDPRYMPNIISSAMVDAPPSNAMADALGKRNKVHHFDKQTDEGMIPLFQEGIDGRSRNNKHLLPHRNWCSIRQWTSGTTPPPTPPMSTRDASRSPSPGARGILRRLSSRGKARANRPDGARESLRGSRPPVSGKVGLFRSLSRRRSVDRLRPVVPSRTMSLGRGVAEPRGYGGEHMGDGRLDGGQANSRWGGHDGHAPPRVDGAQDEYTVGDDSQFTSRPRGNAPTSNGQEAPAVSRHSEPDISAAQRFHRTPTGLSAKQRRQVENYQVDLERGLDIRLNAEINGQDPAGITVPYRMLVPRLQY